MLKKRMYYLIMLAGIFYLMLLYDFRGLRFMAGCFLVFPFGSLLLLVLQTICSRFSLEADSEWVYRGEGTSISFTFENRGFLPVGRVLLSGKLQTPGEKETKIRQYILGVGVRDRETVQLAIETQHCGEARLEKTQVRIYDVLGLFSLPVRGGCGFTVYVLPRVDAGYGSELERVVHSFADAQEDDIYIRGYRQGDSIHRIYWKLSAKEGELQVRDYEPFSSVSLFLDFRQDLREQAAEWDSYLEKAMSILAYLSKPGQNMTEVVWGEGESLCRYTVHNSRETAACMCAVLGQEGSSAVYFEAPVFALEQGYRLDGEGRLYLGGALFL